MINYHFCNINQSKNKIQENDEFLNELNDFNLNIYLKKDSNGTLSEYKDLLKKSVLNFKKEEMLKINQILRKINIDWKKFNLPKMTIFFIKTNGNEAFSLPYTRENYIVLPERVLSIFEGQPLSSLSPGLIIHELFHVLSRKYPNIKNELYKVFGFYNIEKKYNETFVINPDAPFYNWAIKLKTDDSAKEYNCLLALFFDKNKFDWNSVLNLDQNIIIPKFKTNINNVIKNTDYTIHPEEICAEHFRLIFVSHDRNQFYGDDEIKDKDILIKFKTVLNNFKF